MHRLSLRGLWRRELEGYSLETFRHDLLAGLTVGAVALPLALAFGVASGATAAAGLVTAIVAGVVIGSLSGAPYQISGPTGAMSAVLLVVAQQHGLPGVWVAGFLSGAVLLLVGLLRLGRFIAFIPSSVITGFTSGIAVLIAVGQLDAILGVQTPAAPVAAQKLAYYLTHLGEIRPSLPVVWLGGGVILVMLVWPRAWRRRLPSSLVALLLATAAAWMLELPVATVREIPSSPLLADRLRLAELPWSSLRDLVLPAVSIAALGAVESLLCGAVAANMTGVRLQANQELIAQGVGNLVIPWLGGVPATAAIARTGVGIEAGGRTRLVSVVHALFLLASMLALAPVMSRVPLAALAGVLMVTAWRMNEWESIHFLFGRRFKADIVAFSATLVATVTLDLTQAILIGAVFSAAVFLNRIASLEIYLQPLDRELLLQRGLDVHHLGDDVHVAYLVGPLFFAASGIFHETFTPFQRETLVLSMRGVPLIDVSGVQAVRWLAERLRDGGGRLMLAGVHAPVLRMLERAGVVEELGRENLFWSADQALLAADARRAPPPWGDEQLESE